MKLLKLQLENFRNYGSHTYKFNDKNITVLLGPNGRGKTNFLEAIYFLALGKSFRSITSDNLISWEKEFLRVNAEILDESDKETVNLEVFFSSAPTTKKAFKRNEVTLKASEYIGSLLVVLFHPEDLNILYLSPQLRRRYLDILLSQTNKKYLIALLKYGQALKQRNILLHQIREREFKNQKYDELLRDLDSWDYELISFGKIITAYRDKFTEVLNEKLEKFYRTVSDRDEKVTVKYENFATLNNSDDYEKIMENKRKKDIFTARTTAGPHLDDLKFFINGKEILISASRGEFRTLMIALKLAEIDYIKQSTGENPILLLDDVFSELDKKRKSKLLGAIKDLQTIITATELADLDELAIKKDLVNLVSEG